MLNRECMTSTSTFNHVAGLTVDSELERLLLRAPRALKRIDRNYWHLFRAIISNRKRKRVRSLRADSPRSTAAQIVSA